MLLQAFNGKPQPDWPYGITLNSAIAFLSTTTKGFMLVPAAAYISQSIWINYTKKPYPLHTLTTYDAASRGPWGALQLLWALKVRRLVCLGAVLTVLTVGIGPTIQQAIVVEVCSVPTMYSASVPRARSYIQTDDTYKTVNTAGKEDAVPPDMIASLYSGIFHVSSQPGKTSLDVVPECPTNDCTFPQFESLAVCSSCRNITQMLDKTCFTLPPLYFQGGFGPSRYTQCTFSLPNGLQINQSSSVINNISNWKDEAERGTMAVSTMLPLVEPTNHTARLLDITILNGSVSNGIISAHASQCSLYWCVQSYEAKVVTGNFIEHTVQSRENWKHLQTEMESGQKPGQWSLDLPGVNKTSEFVVFDQASMMISNWLYYKFTFSDSLYLQVERTTDRDLIHWRPDVTNNFTGESRSLLHLRDVLRIVRVVGYQEVISNLAKAITTYIRKMGSIDFRSESWSRLDTSNAGPADPAIGTAYISEAYIRIRWPWLTFLRVILLSTSIFLLVVARQSSRHGVAVWKSEPLALLYAGLELDEQEQRRFSNIAEMQTQSEKTKVRLRDTGSGLRLEQARS